MQENMAYRFVMNVDKNGNRYRADYEATQHRDPMGIDGSRVVRLMVWKDGDLMMYYNREWIRSPEGPEGRNVLRGILKKVG